MKNAICVVTGGSGFIGSNLVRKLLAEGAVVRVVDNFSTGRRENIEEIAAAITLIEGDIRDNDLMHRAFQGATYVFHEAAVPSVPRSVENPSEAISVAADGTVSVLEAARDAGVSKVVYAASSSAYGNQSDLPKHEGQRPDPLSPYAVGKLAGEHLCRAFWECYGLETVALRYFNVFGPRQDPNSPYGAVIPKFISALMRKVRPTVFGDGKQSRDFTFVENVVAANLAAAKTQDTKGRAVNVACGTSYTLLDLLDQLKVLFDRQDIQPIFEPERPGDVRHSMADISAAKSLIGYEVTTDFAEGLKQTVEWYQTQPIPNN
ncbi:MAG: SDR family oxidoreductase [Deltaproteobacteria bacterium]|nr:SDR family oxidoreductase [Deltaproteobacteria bacterium]